jgi:alpha-mannosidase
VSNEVDFFQDFEAAHGAELEDYGACYGNEWDLYTATIGEVTAKMKRAVEGLRAAEGLAVLASQDDPTVWGAWASARDSAMLACALYYDHSFGPGPGVTDAQRNTWQRRMQSALTDYVNGLLGAASQAVTARIAQPAGVERHMVFNPLSWTRSDVADLVSAQPEPRHVVDVETGAVLPSQTVTIAGQSRLRVKVPSVPSMGYRVVQVLPGAAGSFPPAATVTLPTIDNGLVRVTLGTRGQITSLQDPTDGGREYVGSGSALNDIGSSSGTGTVTLESQGPVSVTLRLSAGSMTRETRVTLFAGSRRVEVRNDINQNFTGDVGFTSRFDLAGMTMRHEEVGMIARVGRKSQGGDYANENTRTDGLTLNHFVDLSLASRGVTVSAWDGSFFRAGNSDPWTLDATTPSIRTVVGNQVDGAGAGIYAQGYDSKFLHRLAFGIHGAYDPAAAMRFALEHQNPFHTARVQGAPNSPLPATTYSMLTIDSPEVLLWAWKPAEEGPAHGWIARVWNVAEGPRTGLLTVAGSIASARHVTHIETDLGSAPLSAGRLPFSLASQQMATFRLMLSDSTGTVSVGDGAPRAESQLAAYPNPARTGRGATLSFSLAGPGHVRLTLHDITGARRATIADGHLPAGRHDLRWNQATDRSLPPGLYFARLETSEGIRGTRVALIE